MKNGVNGLVCKTGDVAAFARAIRRLKQDSSLRKKLSRGALESVKPFAQETVYRKMKKIYEELLS